MSSFSVPVFKIEDIEKHPDADTLSICRFLGWQCITKTGSVNVGDLCVYIPLDAIIPETLQTELGLKDLKRVRTVRLRGIISQGLVMKAREGMKEGDDVAEALGIVKWEPPLTVNMAGKARRDDPRFIRYTDIENIKNFNKVLQDGEEIIVSEKLHGTNWRGVAFNITSETGEVTKDVLIGSHRMNWQDVEGNLYWRAAKESGVVEVLKKNPGIQIFGEVYGHRVQDLGYGFPVGQIGLAVFDILDTQGNKYFDYDDFINFCQVNNLKTVPFIHRGPWNKDILKLKDGNSTIADANHMREGIVIRLAKERYDHKCGRVILKAISENYELRKGGTENH